MKAIRLEVRPSALKMDEKTLVGLPVNGGLLMEKQTGVSLAESFMVVGWCGVIDFG